MKKSITASLLTVRTLYEELIGQMPESMPYQEALEILVERFGFSYIEQRVKCITKPPSKKISTILREIDQDLGLDWKEGLEL